MKGPRLTIFPLTLSQANELVSRWHRHHKPCAGHRFSLGVRDDAGVIHGACIVGRPVARNTPQYEVLEVTRLVTDGTFNACSALYAAAARAGREMGYQWIQTFVLKEEPGTSLKAAGWEFDGESGGGNWNCPSRGDRRMDQPQQEKHRWKKVLNRPVASEVAD